MLGQLSIPHYRPPLSPDPPAKGDKVGGRGGCGENVTGAANQQERLEPQWVVGFVDGEGCFHIMERGEHLSPEGLRTIASIALEMNTRTNTAASRILRDWMSTSPKGEGTVRPSQRCEEVAGDRGPPSAGKVIEATA